MHTRAFTCLISGRTGQLPPNLYPKGKRPGKFDYKLPTSKKISLPNKLTIDEAINTASKLNLKHYPELSIAATPYTMEQGFIPYEVDKFMLNWAKRQHNKHGNVYEGAKLNNNWSSKFRYAKHFKDAYPNTLLTDLNRQDFEEWFHSDIYPSTLLDKAAHVLRKFLKSRYEENCFHCANALDPDLIMEYMPVKKRQRLTQEQFDAIRSLADKADDFMMVNAMDLGYHTLLRITNVINLRFNYDNVLMEGINKKKELYLKPLKKKTNIRIMIDLKVPQAKPLVKIIKQCKPTRNIATAKGKADTKCPFLVHHDFDTYMESDKEHPMEVTTHFIQARFRHYRDQLECFQGIERKTLPTFHEVRSLGAYNVLLETRDKVWVSRLLGHDDIKTTEKFYLNGHGDDVVIQKLFA